MMGPTRGLFCGKANTLARSYPTQQPEKLERVRVKNLDSSSIRSGGTKGNNHRLMDTPGALINPSSLP